MTQARAATVRFYLDEDVLGLAKVLGQIRLDVTYPTTRDTRRGAGSAAPCTLISRGDKDTEWIPRVAAEGWLIITRDSQIQAHRSHVLAMRESGARMVALSGKEARSTWE